jgi:hypothetical protein
MSDEFFSSLLRAVDSLFEVISGDDSGDHTDAPLFSRPTTYKPATRYGPDSMQHVGIGAIRESDPDFVLADFLVRVGQMFETYHKAFDLGDLKPARRFIEECTYDDLAKAAEKSGRHPHAPRMMTVRVIRPTTARHEYDLDLIRVLISADVAGESDVLCEYWELIRKRGLRTKTGLDLMHCPNCGAPIDDSDPTRCAYCDQRLADPALDWVVRKISIQ